MKKYGRRLRLSPEEEQMIVRLRSGVDTKPQIQRNVPRIFITDIETVPLKAYIWDLKTRYVSPSMLDEVHNNWWMLSWAGKYLLEDEIYSDVVTPEEAVKHDDSEIVHSIWNHLNDADIVITHNGKRFDHRMLNMRFLLHGLPPPAPFKIVDTLTVARSKFKFPSYKLGYIADVLGISQKRENDGFDMWRRCMEGDEEALQDMLYYNEGDIIALEDFYLVIRPWINNHPNVGVYLEYDTPVCPVCGSTHLHPIAGSYSTTAVSKFQNMRCDECGFVAKKRTTELSRDVRRKLITGTN